MSKFKEIDFLPATDQLNELMFDVQKVSLVTSDKRQAYNQILVDKYFGIINGSSNEVLSVVSEKYDLITNKQAYELGEQAFVQLFSSVKMGDLIPFKVIASKRKTFCHIDLIHKNVDFQVWEQETWLPFIRITNSYNRTFPLSFELGFVRKLCSNGVIFDKKTIRVRYNHSRGAVPTSIVADVSKLTELENDFKKSLLNLKRFHVNRRDTLPLICKALNLDWKLPKETPPQMTLQYEKYLNFRTMCIDLTKAYMDIDGENSFSVMNVMTDLVSHQEDYKNLPSFSQRANIYYHRISTWMSEYCTEAVKQDFRIEKYLGEYRKYQHN